MAIEISKEIALKNIKSLIDLAVQRGLFVTADDVKQMLDNYYFLEQVTISDKK